MAKLIKGAVRMSLSCLRHMGELKAMQRQRGELVPIGEVIGGLDGPVKAIGTPSGPTRQRGGEG